MENLVTVVTKYGSFDVDRKKLGEALKFSEMASKSLGHRPGQPTDLTGTASDPISGELFHTLDVIVMRYRKKHRK